MTPPRSAAHDAHPALLLADLADDRTPLRRMVRMTRCSASLSLTARRAALIRVVNAESETTRPPQTASISSSLLTTRPRLRIKNSRRSKTQFERDQLSPATQVAPLGIEHGIAKPEDHPRSPGLIETG